MRRAVPWTWALVLMGLLPILPVRAATVYSSYLWHLQQPNYWPEKLAGQNRYMVAYEQLGGSPTYPGHPENNLAEIFGKDDRTAIYQYRSRDTINAIRYLPDAGAQLSYSGVLIENISSLGQHHSLGYGPEWNGAIREGLTWTTSRGKPRLQPLGFTFHHAIAPLIDKDALRKEIAINKDIYWKAWYGADYGPGREHPKGFRCAEESFSIRIIKELVEAGYEWVIVPNHHLSRTHRNYVPLHGKGLYDPPNRADQINANNNGGWFSGEIDGRGSTESVPFSFQAHWAKYVDPANGQEYKIIVVPMTDLGSYRDGYSQQGIEILHTLNAYATADHPCIALFSHDGDNAWGGGFSYYGEAVPSFVSQASSSGYRPTTIQTFLDEHPPPAGDVVHVEDGSWFNAADDWGHPQFLNWLWYPQRNRSSPSYDYRDPATYADITNGWAEDFRNWAVLVAAQNVVSTADQIEREVGSGRVDSWRIQDPVGGNANNAELAWHFFLPGINSCYMYYGTSLDMEVKPTLACNQALAYANPVIEGRLSEDRTPPTVFIPQRYPWNPGSTNYGAAYGYRSWLAPSEFMVWTLSYDVSGITSIVLKVRADLDGDNPVPNHDNETYAGGASVGPWQTFAMTRRAGDHFVGNLFNNPEVNFFITPSLVADQYGCRVTGYNDQLLDYYVEAVDARGNVHRSDIQHVYVGPGSGPPTVSFSPVRPEPEGDLTVTYRAAGRPLAGAASVRMTFTFDAWASSNTVDMAASGSNIWTHTLSLPASTPLATVYFRDAQDGLDNNDGPGWSVPIAAGTGTAARVTFDPAAPNGCGPVTIMYHPGSGPLAGSSNVFIHVGRNGWMDIISPDPPMAPVDDAWTWTYTPSPGTIQINCTFHNDHGIWGGQDWAVRVDNCTGGTATVIRLVLSTPVITDDPPAIDDQNHVGDAFDLDPTGGDAVTVDRGGFGTFGHLYANYDDTYFYIGGVGADVVAGNNAMIIFLGFDTLADDAFNLWSIHGPPLGLDHLHNVAFMNTPMDIAILLGDEHGDGTDSGFRLGNDYPFGQGVFYLSSSGTFVPVAGARLSQFDGAGTHVTTTADDDGNRLTDRWECAIPWASLNAPGGITNLSACHIAGLLVNSSTNGVDRYISGNYLGLTATNAGPADAWGNVGMGFVAVEPMPIERPGGDWDGDGLSDDWERRYFGGTTNAVAEADSDEDGFDNRDEFELGTDPRSALSLLTFTDIVVTGSTAQVTWQSVGGRRYRLDIRDRPVPHSAVFTQTIERTEQDVAEGIGATETYTGDINAHTTIFFRVHGVPSP